MIIRVNDITDRVRHLADVEEIDRHPVLRELHEHGECRFRSPLSIDVSVVREYDHIRLEGCVGADITLECSRCLIQYEMKLASKFTIFYSRHSGRDIEDEEVELGERELVSAYYEGDEIDLSPEISDHVLIELPLKPLCNTECKGLCQSCGADLNRSRCLCPENGGSLAFSALKNFKPSR